ncbi:MAG: PAC2 family protein [Ilumatobacter sp.]|uniref:PAC2 family protein n=1 Tax=Ilumatobacter sp. TaxID=1967498 RepID=UPI002637F8FD|nr:PAC2 family protein [Ilumatobacter sp.]MDJ0771598.1 PAC2 family protein [Ilumatobacter sp.]
MQTDDVLTIEADELGELRSPVMLIALTGLFDIGGAATTALDEFAPADAAVTVAEIDPDPFYDFTQQRPQVEIEDGDIRVIRWPENKFDVVRGSGDRDLVVLVGVEPHLAWPSYSACIAEVADRLGCEAVVTVGSAAEPVPHTRTPLVTGSTTDAGLAQRLGIGQPSYQGVTGVVGVIQADLTARGLPAVSLRVGVPHYLMSAEHPQAVAALQTHLGHVLGVPAPDVGHLADDIERWRGLHDEVVAGDVQLQLYVKMLEQEYDKRAEAAIPSADDLGAQFEEFLKEQRDDGPAGT